MKRFAPIALPLLALGLASCVGPDQGPSDDEDAPVAEASEAIKAVTPFSVVIASDPQFWWSIDDITGDTAASLGWSQATMENLGNQTNREQVQAINKLAAGTTTIAGYLKPSFVIVNGDLTEYARTVQRQAYEAEYPGKLTIPVFPGLGNHDIGGNVHGSCLPSAEELAIASAKCTGAAVGQSCVDFDQMTAEGDNWCGNEMRRWMARWISDHRSSLNSFAPSSLGYSWTKNNIRFLELHNYPTYAEPDFQIASSMTYLKNELATAAARGERVVINFHDFMDKDLDTPTTDDQPVIDALSGYEYNVIGIFAAHVHGESGFRGNIKVKGIDIPWFRSGSATWNHALLVQFDAGSMKVASINTRGGTAVAHNVKEAVQSQYDSDYFLHASAPHTSSYPVNNCVAGYQPISAGGACVPAYWQRATVGMVDGSAEAGDQVGRALARGDFNGDGFADLAIGAPYEDVGATSNAGAVSIVYGGFSGLSVANTSMWHLASPGIPGDPGTGDTFGWSLTAGDFNGDGKDDLAVGAPGRSVTGHDGAGEVFILYGSSAGITASGVQEWSQESPFVQGAAEGGDSFGWSLAAGDFNGDGMDDLAIGIPNEDLPAGNDGGSVSVFRGTPSGLSAVGDPCFDQNYPGVEGGVESGDRFGWSLAAGDFNGDGRADLAIGSPYEDLYGYDDGGEVHVFMGTPSGLSTAGDPGFDQNYPGVEGGVETADKFGWSLATGDFNGDGMDELVIGVPYEDIGGTDDGGSVHVFRGTPAGLSTAGDPGFDQNYGSVAGAVESGDHFGWALATGDFNGDGMDDLAIGTPDENLPGGTDAGTVHVFLGTVSGLTTAGDPGFDQDYGYIPDVAESGDQFGFALAAGDFNGDGKADLAIGVPSENMPLGGDDNDGMVNTLYGGSSGLTTNVSQCWTQTW